MRYLKVLILACFIFLAIVFFFQNQAVLATKVELSLDLFFIPQVKSLPLPFYFLMGCAFLVGVLLAIFMLVWDRLLLSARIMKDKWQIKSLSTKLARAESLLQNRPRYGFFDFLRKIFTVEERVPAAQQSTALAPAGQAVENANQAQNAAALSKEAAQSAASSSAAPNQTVRQPA
ncbi:MAG: DUF1049 domain-containing protein [Desulfovibrionaceae bacterium]|nr:DUF1049 domain-containing protein [Desulfovibrionaceae bacterium]